MVVCAESRGTSSAAREPARRREAVRGKERRCGCFFMVAVSRWLHGTGADVGLEKARPGESRKSPPWCLTGTRALPRKKQFPRASPGNLPEKKDQEDGRVFEAFGRDGKVISIRSRSFFRGARGCHAPANVQHPTFKTGHHRCAAHLQRMRGRAIGTGVMVTSAGVLDFCLLAEFGWCCVFAVGGVRAGRWWRRR